MRQVLGVAMAVTLAAAPAYDMMRLPYRAPWGPYLVTVEQATTEPVPLQRLRVLDRGRVVREITDYRIADVRFVALARGRAPALWAGSFSGGAHCCTTEYVFTREGGVRNAFIFDGANGGIHDASDLDRDGRLEFVASNDALAYFDDLCYACSPGVTMVIGWDGTRYADVTRRFPQPALRWADQYRTQFLEALPLGGDDGEIGRRQTALGYLANNVVAGRGAAARAWLLGYLPKSTRDWLLRHEAEMHKLLIESRGKVRVSQQRVFAP